MIERTLFFFKDGEEMLFSFNERFFALATLLNRLLNETYTGKKITFINLFFSTEETYNLYPQSPKYYTHNYKGHISYNDVFDLNYFQKLNENDQATFIWERACEILRIISEAIKNEHLLAASNYAYNKGIETDLNPDYKMVEAAIKLFGRPYKAAIWVNFRKDGMYSTLTVESDGIIVFEKEIDKTKNGTKFFLEIYKSIEVEENTIVVKGRKDVEYLPLKVIMDSSLLT
jgi:hypothetical protein